MIEGSKILCFPGWVYRPGTGEPDRETLEAAKRVVPARYDAVVPMDDPALVYGLTLNDAGFFWECHEILEAVWKAAPQGGPDRILLRACIQVANGNLKSAMEQPRAAARLYAEAAAEVAECIRRLPKQGFAAGYPADRLVAALLTPEPPLTLLIAENMQQNS